MSVADQRSLRILVTGRVQGVGYRAWAERTAHALNVVGWVRNLPDGSVEIRSQGPADVVARFVELLWEGPSLAVVRDVVLSEEPPRGEFTDFSVRR